MLDVASKVAGRLVAAGAVLLQRPHDDPIQLAAHELAQALAVGLAAGGNGRERRGQQGAQSRAGARRLFLADDPPYLIVRGLGQALLVKRRGAGQQLV